MAPIAEQDLPERKTNIILTGESGSGKTEIALYLARRLAGRMRAEALCAAAEDERTGGRTAGAEPRRLRAGRLIDMDQTKGMFRARDFEKEPEMAGVEFLYGPHFMDMPVVPPGVVEKLTDRSAVNIIDVGGNETGALTRGQFAPWLTEDDTETYFVINPYRSFSGSFADIRDMMERVAAFGRMRRMKIICNPHLGPDTKARDVEEGVTRLAAALREGGMSIACVAAMAGSGYGAAGKERDLPVLLIDPVIRYP